MVHALGSGRAIGTKRRREVNIAVEFHRLSIGKTRLTGNEGFHENAAAEIPASWLGEKRNGDWMQEDNRRSMVEPRLRRCGFVSGKRKSGFHDGCVPFDVR
jgi:hypothetical protein